MSDSAPPQDAMRRIKDWPAAERPREKLLAAGANTLSDAELLALVLRTGDAAAHISAVDQARRLLDGFGSLHKLAAANTAELCGYSGIGPAKAAELQAVFELARRFSAEAFKPGAQFNSADDVFTRYRNRFLHSNKEHFLALLLDAKHILIRDITISTGSLTASIVHPREVFNPAVRESAAAIILAHNHPSGDPAPSREDIATTNRLVKAGQILGIDVLDHIIIGSNGYTSLRNAGHMEQP